MIRIEVKAAVVARRDITIKQGPKAGQISTFFEQEAWAYTFNRDGEPHPFPQRCVINIDPVTVNGTPQAPNPYPVGNYQPDPSCLYIDRFGCLTLGRLKLKPISPAISKAA